uniref:hypothetical protein n=1 Tax=Clostridium sp. NkU-1 TaxID=1095009 RepID=UPI0032619BB5
MKNYPQDSRQYQTLLNKYEYYSGCVSFALNQKDSAKPFRNYPCVLELIDSWFHTDDKTRMSNKLEVIARMKKMQDSYKKQIREAISELRRGSYQYLEDEGFASSLLKALPKAEEEKGYLNPPIWTDKKAVDSKKLLSYFDEEEKKKRELLNQELNAQSDMIKKVNECLNDVENWGHCKCASVFASDEDYDSNLVYIDDIDIILSDIKKLENKFYVALGRVRGFKAIAEKYGIVEETKKVGKSGAEDLF